MGDDGMEDARMIAKGAVSGEIANHIQKPFLCLGVRFSTKEWRCGSGDGQTDGGKIRGI